MAHNLITMDSEEVEAWGRIVAKRTRARVLESRKRRNAVREAGRRAAAEMALVLAAERGVTSVVLFGSLAGEGGLVHGVSDIDIAVTGLPLDRESAAYRAIADLTDRHVDLVRTEEASARLRERIEREGEVLHDAG